MKKSFGWKRSLPDFRDHWFSPAAKAFKEVKSQSDFSSKFPPVYDQGQLGSCTYNAIAGMLHYFEKLQAGSNVIAPSRLFGYYNERLLEGTTQYDAGAYIRDGMKVTQKYGYCDEKRFWAYNINKFTIRPSLTAYNEAKNHLLKDYARVLQDFNVIRTILTQEHPIVFGFTVYDNIYDQDTESSGIIKMPGINNKIVGGHAVLLVGHDDYKNLFKIRNSWGSSWGSSGYGYMPYQYLLNPQMCDDFWVTNTIPNT